MKITKVRLAYTLDLHRTQNDIAKETLVASDDEKGRLTFDLAASCLVIDASWRADLLLVPLSEVREIHVERESIRPKGK